MKIALTTIGCKLNQSEVQDLQNDLSKAGHIIVAKNRPHDIHIVNACSITKGAEQITRQKIRELKKANPHLQIFIMGCYNQQIPEVSKVFQNKSRILAYIKKHFPIAGVKIKNSGLEFRAIKTRALIKIQDGCNFNCSYCTIPNFRGKSRSITPGKIIKQIKIKEQQGYQEIVIVGVNIQSYKYGRINFDGLLKKILLETKTPRIRFSSLDPRLISANFLALLKNSRICPHLHLSLQSGSDRILRSMNRQYTTKQYLKIVRQARQINPLTSITTDIIIGFPGEKNNDFMDTLNFINKIDFLKIHIFPYSIRANTAAANLNNQINGTVKKQRFQILNNLAEKQINKFLKKMKGKVMPVLFENPRKGLYHGYSPNYILVKKKSDKNLKNKIIKVKL